MYCDKEIVGPPNSETIGICEEPGPDDWITMLSCDECYERTTGERPSAASRRT